jgi:hypothetical protein
MYSSARFSTRSGSLPRCCRSSGSAASSLTASWRSRELARPALLAQRRLRQPEVVLRLGVVGRALEDRGQWGHGGRVLLQDHRQATRSAGQRHALRIACQPRRQSPGRVEQLALSFLPVGAL